MPSLIMRTSHSTPSSKACVSMKKRFSFALPSCLLFLACLAFSGCGPSQQLSSTAIDLSNAGLADNFRLHDADGHVRTMADFKGKVVMLFFGFTQCPDVCPTALIRAAEVRKKLKDDASRLQVIFVTIDPERDTPTVLKNYTAAFDPSFIGLSGSLEVTRQTADAFKIFYQKVPTGSSYSMDHSAVTYLLDPSGRMRVGLRSSVPGDDIVHDINYLLHNAS